MMTRSRIGANISNRGENVNDLGKYFDNSTTIPTRSRAVLGELKNVGVPLPQKSFKKPEAPKPQEKFVQDFSETSVHILRPSFSNLTSEQLNEYKSYVKQRKDIRSHFLLSCDPQDCVDLDTEIAYDTASVSPFAETIFNYLQDLEFRQQPLSCNFLASCVAVTPRMRYILVNWLVQVHQSYKLQPETLYLCVSLMDRYIQKSGESITKDMFQLVGITAMFLASKFEEMYPPDIGDFSSITDSTYTKRDIRTCEQLILQCLDFYLSIPSPIVFLRRLSRATKADHLTHNLAKYFLELTIQEYDLAYLPGNLRAAVATCLSHAVCSNTASIDEVWTRDLQYLSGYSVDDIRQPLRILAKAAYRQNSPSKYRAIYDKYRTDNLYEKVAALPQLRSTIMETLADLKFDEEGSEVTVR